MTRSISHIQYNKYWIACEFSYNVQRKYESNTSTFEFRHEVNILMFQEF